MWEIEFEHNATFLISPSKAGATTIESELPITVAGLAVNLIFDQEFHGIPNDISKISRQFLLIRPVDGDFATPFHPIGKSPLCDYTDGIATYNYYAALSANFTCPVCTVHVYDFLYLPFALFGVCIAIVVVLYKRPQYSAWKLVNVSFALFMGVVVVVGGLVVLVMALNVQRSQSDAFCSPVFIESQAVTGKVALPFCVALMCIVLGIVWFNVIAFSFPREGSKSNERFCAGYTSRQRITWFFGLWMFLVALLFLTLWVPQYIWVWGHDDRNIHILMSMVVASPFIAAEMVVAISWICLTTRCRNEKFDGYFSESSVEYMTVQSF